MWLVLKKQNILIKVLRMYSLTDSLSSSVFEATEQRERSICYEFPSKN